MQRCSGARRLPGTLGFSLRAKTMLHIASKWPRSDQGAAPPRPAISRQLRKSLRMYRVRAVAVGLALATLSACIAYRGEYWGVAPIVIAITPEFPEVSIDTQLDIACPTNTGLEIAFVDLVKGTFALNGRGYYGTRLQISQATSPEVTCPFQKNLVEYIGTPPSNDRARNRRIFVGFVGQPALYRVSLEGASARVEFTDREAAMRMLPPALAGDLRNKPWGREIIDAYEIFYRGIRWQSTDKLAVGNMQRSGDGSVTAVTITFRR